MLIINSIFAGLCIGLGCWLYVMAPSPLIGALLFSCGLCAVRLMQYNLFTGKVQYLFTKQYKWYEYLLILIFNLFGIAVMFLIASPEAKQAAAVIGQNKAQQDFSIALWKGIGCGALMTLATYKDTPLYITVLGVFAFIAAGFNHCIADAFYFLATGQFSLNWIAILIGNIIGGLLISPHTFGAKK